MMYNNAKAYIKLLLLMIATTGTYIIGSGNEEKTITINERFRQIDLQKTENSKTNPSQYIQRLDDLAKQFNNYITQQSKQQDEELQKLSNSITTMRVFYEAEMRRIEQQSFQEIVKAKKTENLLYLQFKEELEQRNTLLQNKLKKKCEVAENAFQEIDQLTKKYEADKICSQTQHDSEIQKKNIEYSNSQKKVSELNKTIANVQAQLSYAVYLLQKSRLFAGIVLICCLFSWYKYFTK